MARTRAQNELKVVLEASLLSDSELELYLNNLGIEPAILDQWLDVAVRETERSEVEFGGAASMPNERPFL